MIGLVHSVVKGGKGLVFHEKDAIFVDGVIGGEVVEFRISGRKRSVQQATLLRVLEPAPARIPPPCPLYGECGGCNLQHMSYTEQLSVKKGILAESLRRIGKISQIPPIQVHASPPFRYRSKSEFQVRAGQAGFFRRQSQRIVPVRSCLIIQEKVESFLNAVAPDLAQVAKGQLSVIGNGQQLAAVLSTAESQCYLSPENNIELAWGEFRYLFSPLNFIQANLHQLPTMLQLLTEQLAEFKPSSAVDLYCGAGFFTLPIASLIPAVYALENQPENLIYLRKNLERHSCAQVQVIAADVSQSDLPGAEFYVVDPPRGGITPPVCQKIIRAAPAAVAYFSCDAATFARDTAFFLRHGYHMEDLHLLDNYPQTDHLEIFAILTR